MVTPSQKKFLVVTLGQYHNKPWWWNHINTKAENCLVEYHRFCFKNKHSMEISTSEFPLLFIRVLKSYIKWHRKYDYIFTFECDLLGFFISLIQTLITTKNMPHHVILQFIMREKTNTINSNLKYSIMKFCFKSLHKAVCSSKTETDYYHDAFGWPANKAKYIPFHTDPKALEERTKDDGFIFSGGKSFRDYETLMQSLSSINSDSIVVGYEKPARHDRITIFPRLPWNVFLDYMVRSRIVVVPLEERKISAGQTIILYAMALGKPVIATNTTSTIDYIDSGKNGILVPPNDPKELRKQILILLQDSALRCEIGNAAKSAVSKKFLPQHYANNIFKKIIFPDISRNP